MATGTLSRKELLEIVEKTQRPLARERLPSSSYENGIPRAALTELCGSAKVEWLVHFFNDNPRLKILWIEENFTLLPTSFLQLGLSPNRIIYVEAKKDLVKHVRKALKFQVFDCIVCPSVFEELRVLKALQLLSEKANCATVLLNNGEPKRAWPISVQLEIHKVPMPPGKPTLFSVQIHKEKGAGLEASP